MRTQILLAAAVVTLLAGCTEGKVVDLHETPTATTSTSASPTTLAPTSSTPSPWATVLPEQEQAYLLKVEAIDPGSTSDDKAALKNGYWICARIAESWSTEDLIDWIRQMGSTDGFPRLSPEQATEILTAAKDELCV